MKKYIILLLFPCTFFVSCQPKTSSPKEAQFKPTQNGFGVMVQWVGIDTGPGAELYYKGTNETPVQVWPCIGTGGDPILYTNDIVLLLADKPDDQGRMGNGALIVVQKTGPAMDISDDVLKIAAEQAHVDFKNMLRTCKPMSLTQVEGKMKVYYVAKLGSGSPDLEVQITWQQIFEIMRDVKSSGNTNKVINTDVLYLQKEYSN
jgi:hypothetical protein